jgi:hypothetical protein
MTNAERLAEINKECVRPWITQGYKNADILFLLAYCKQMREALEEIKLGRGPFDRDPHTHANNTIEAMKGEAMNALTKDPLEEK